MPRKLIEVGIEGNDGTGDSIREAFIKTNDNFQELYSVFAAGAEFVSTPGVYAGYVKFVNGTVFQWGKATTDGSGNCTVTMPYANVSFLNCVQLTPRSLSKIYTSVGPNFDGQFSFRAWDETGSGTIVEVFWFVVSTAEL